MISTFFNTYSSKLKTKVIYYRSYKEFNGSDFLCSLKKLILTFSKTKMFFNKHAPLKKKFVRVNIAPFMNRAFQKEIYVRSRLRNKYWVRSKFHLRKTKQRIKKRNKCVKIRQERDIWTKFEKKVSKVTKVFGILLNTSWQIKIWFLAMTSLLNDSDVISRIIKLCQNHPSVLKI